MPPAGYRDRVKEEDENILIGDNFIAPVTQQFGGLGDIFILPDQASVTTPQYPGPNFNGCNDQNRLRASHHSANGIVPGFAPEPLLAVRQRSAHQVRLHQPLPRSQQVSPFRWCDACVSATARKFPLNAGTGATAKFSYTSTHEASKFTGVITNNFTFRVRSILAAVSLKKFRSARTCPLRCVTWTSTEVARVYSDWWQRLRRPDFSTSKSIRPTRPVTSQP